MADHKLIDLSDAHHGPAAGVALIGAFLNARSHFTVDITIGVSAHRPDKMIVLVEMIGIRVVFTPIELQRLGRAMIAGIPTARALGASETDENELRKFATMLIRNAEDAATMSPHGLN